MKAEALGTQRHLVGRRLRMADVEVHTKYVFPFVDESWSVPFFIIDAMAYGPRLFRGELELLPEGLRTALPSEKLEKIAAVPASRFDTVVHFDPWWVFRGVTGVEREWIDAILATNIAGTFNHEGTAYKVHDLAFDPHLRSLEGVVAKDPVFHTATFRKGDLGLLQLRKPPRA
jgi:hypothetical protein